jgi:diguanylate cyclase (GGDEF)-like protein
LVGRDEAASIALRICQSLDTTWSLGPANVTANVTASASVGVALYPDAGNTPDELLRSADVALYEAKAAGRACVRFYDAES